VIHGARRVLQVSGAIPADFEQAVLEAGASACPDPVESFAERLRNDLGTRFA
jgi:hypothetical protein